MERPLRIPALVLAAAAACSSSSTAPASNDAGARDGSPPLDASDAHASVVDATSPDAASGGDASASDAGQADASFDSGAVTPNLCLDCVANKCMATARSCANDATCTAWASCVNDCAASPAPPATCFRSCDTANAGASGLFAAAYACMCVSCAALCTTVNACAYGVDGGP